MINTPTIKDYILDPDKTSSIRQAIQEGVTQYGMQSFDQALASLVKGGIVAAADGIRYATHPNELALHLQGINDASNRAWASVEMAALDSPPETKPEWLERE